jgi:hypothetical protein
MLCCFSKRKKKKIVISLIEFNKLMDCQKDILRRDYDIYFSEFSGD